MRSVNQVTIIGNLTRDPRTRETKDGQQVTTFSVATNRYWKTREGESRSMTEYHDIVTWSRLAEICGQHLNKGKLVYVNGYLKTRSWTDDNEIKHFKTEIVAHDVIMLDRRPDEASDVDQYDAYSENPGQGDNNEVVREENAPF